MSDWVSESEWMNERERERDRVTVRWRNRRDSQAVLRELRATPGVNWPWAPLAQYSFIPAIPYSFFWVGRDLQCLSLRITLWYLNSWVCKPCTSENHAWPILYFFLLLSFLSLWLQSYYLSLFNIFLSVLCLCSLDNLYHQPGFCQLLFFLTKVPHKILKVPHKILKVYHGASCKGVFSCL